MEDFHLAVMMHLARTSQPTLQNAKRSFGGEPTTCVFAIQFLFSLCFRGVQQERDDNR